MELKKQYDIKLAVEDFGGIFTKSCLCKEGGFIVWFDMGNTEFRVDVRTHEELHEVLADARLEMGMGE